MGSTILLADDSITIQKVVELTFGETDHRVVAVSSGRELLRRLSEVQPDIVLCDVVMPDLNGYEVCQTLKADPVTLHLPVVLLTGTFEPFDRDRAVASGCDAIVTKPFEGRELVSVVEDLLRRSRSIPVAEPEPSFFPGLGEPEGMPGLEFSTTGFDQMVPPPPVEPSVPEHGIEMTGVSPRPPEATEVDEEFAFGGLQAPAPEPTEPAKPEDADDSWIDRVGTEAPLVGSMAGEFFTAPAGETTEAPVAPPATEPEEGALAPGVLQPWEETADLQAQEAAGPAFAEPVTEPEWEHPSAGLPATGVAEETGFPEPKGGPAFTEVTPTAPWQEPEAAEEPEVGMWPAPPAPPEVPASLGSLNPARESVATAWSDDEIQPEEGVAERLETAPEPDFVHPEPGFPFGAPPAGLVPEEPPVEEPMVDSVAPQPEEASAPAVDEMVEAAGEPAPPTGFDEVSEPIEVPPADEAPPEPAAGVTMPDTAMESVVEEPAPEVGEATPAEETAIAAPSAEALAQEVETTAFAPPELAVAAEPEPLASALEPSPVEAEPAPPAVAITDELIELIADRVLARIPPPELGEAHMLAVAHRAAQLIPPPPPPDIPPLSYELEESDIQRVARRVLEILPPPPPPEPVRLSDDEVEYVAQRVLALVPPAEVQPVVVPPDEVQRITEHVLASMTAPPPPELPDAEVSRVADRVIAMLPPPPEPAPPQAPAELSEAAVEQIAHKVMELATPLIERIAWEVIPDMAEMLVRRRIEELERDAES